MQTYLLVWIWIAMLLGILSPLSNAKKTIQKNNQKTSLSSSSETAAWNGGAPWQTSGSSRSIIEESTYADLPPTIFSPTGRLHSVERVVRASKTPDNPRGNLLIALKYGGGVVVVTTLPTSPFLNVTENSTLFLSNQTSDIPILDFPNCALVTASAGNAVDGRVLRTKIQAFVEYAMETQKESVRAAEVARNLADHLHGNTQTVGGRGGRMLASSALICGNRELWRVDPTGQFWKCHAVAMGRDSDRAEQQLYKLLQGHSKDDSIGDLASILDNLSSEEALQLACDCIETVLCPKESLIPSVNRIPWYSVNIDYTQKPMKPSYVMQNGAFLPPQKERNRE